MHISLRNLHQKIQPSILNRENNRFLQIYGRTFRIKSTFATNELALLLLYNRIEWLCCQRAQNPKRLKSQP